MYQQHFEQQQEASTDTAEPDDTDIEAGDPPPAYYAKILQWSIEKLRSGGRSRKPTSADMRRSLLVAGTMGKARAGMLRQRAMQFLAARPQLLPPVGYHHPPPGTPQPQPQLAMTTGDAEDDEEEPPASAPAGSAFGYADIDLVSAEVEADAAGTTTPLPVEQGQAQAAEDLLSVSAEAIVMSSVELSIRDLDDDETPPPPPPPQPQTPPQTPTPTSQVTRKRKQPIKKPPPLQLPQPLPQPPPKRTRPLQLAGESATSVSTDSEAATGLRTLQASFVDLSMSPSSSAAVVLGGGCRQQASQFSGALGLPWLSPGPECHSFA